MIHAPFFLKPLKILFYSVPSKAYLAALLAKLSMLSERRASGYNIRSLLKHYVLSVHCTLSPVL